MAKRKRRLKARERSQRQTKLTRTLQYYPTVFCTGENLYIGVSSKPMKFKGDRWGNINPKYKVQKKHWLPNVCSFRSENHIVDMRRYKDGDLITCPKCGAPLDFRLFGSNTVPKMVVFDDKQDQAL